MRSGQPGRWTRCIPVALGMVAGLSVAGCGASPDEAAVGGVDNDQPRGLLLNTPRRCCVSSPAVRHLLRATS